MRRRATVRGGRCPSLGLATGAVAVALALSGCGINAGTAARVNDSSLSVAAFQSQVQDLIDKSGRKDVRPAELKQAQRSLLRQYIDNQLIRVVARENGVSVSGADLSEVRSQMKAQRVAVPDAMAEEFARWVALQRALAKKIVGGMPDSQAEQQEASRKIGDMLIRAGREVGVTVNPRYGSWRGGEIVADGALVTPQPSTSPSQLSIPPG